MSATELRAGRELDEAVAEALGLRREVRLAGTTERVTVYSDSPWWQDGRQTLLDVHRHGGPRHYSTDIAAAWNVVETLAERGLFPVVAKEFGGGWSCAFVDPADGVLRDAKADTAPLAICAAALRALDAASHPEPERGAQVTPERMAYETGFFAGLYRRTNNRYAWAAHTAYEEGYQAGRSVWRRPRRTRRAPDLNPNES